LTGEPGKVAAGASPAAARGAPGREEASPVELLTAVAVAKAESVAVTTTVAESVAITVAFAVPFEVEFEVEVEVDPVP